LKGNQWRKGSDRSANWRRGQSHHGNYSLTIPLSSFTGFILISRFWLDIKHILLQLDSLVLTVGQYHTYNNKQCQNDEHQKWRTFYQLNYKRIPFHKNRIY